METSVNNKCKAFTSLEQSRKLAEILPLESADMGYLWNGTSFCDYPVSNKTIFKRIENIPCWSLAALLDIIPMVCLDNFFDDTTKSMKWNCISFPENYHSVETNNYDSSIDACYEMILKLHELKML